MIYNELHSVDKNEQSADELERKGDELSALDKHHAEACKYYEMAANDFVEMAALYHKLHLSAVAKADSLLAKAKALKEEGKSE